MNLKKLFFDFKREKALMITVDKLREELIAEFGSLYQHNDLAHRVEHFEDVFATGMELNELLKYNYKDTDVLLVAYLHDIFSWSRKNHHILSCEFVLGTDNKLINEVINPEMRFSIAQACRTHRASYTGEFYDRFGEMMSAADRGKVKGVRPMIIRSYLYTLGTLPNVSEQERIKTSLQHLKEKYGTNGYAKYPKLYEEAFGDVLNTQRLEVDALKIADYQEIIFSLTLI